MTTETWVEVKIDEIPTGYFVSNTGKVKSPKKELKPWKELNGYLRVKLYLNSKVYRKTVHNLVAECFLENLNNLKTVDHKDGNKENNCLSNLQWMSQIENSRKSLCKIRKFKDPSGIIYEVERLQTFCKKYDLSDGCMRKVWLGLQPYHKGFSKA